LSGLVETIDTDRRQGNLSSAIRLFVLGFYRDQIGFLRDQSSRHPGKAPAQLGA
jgi:predicted DNA-binding ribbon-helix-helix protein